MRYPSIEYMDKELTADLIKGMENLLLGYYKNKNSVLLEDRDTYTRLYNETYSNKVLINKLPYPIEHAEHIDIYNLECTDDGVRYIPGMLIGKEDKVYMASIEPGDKFTSNILGLLLEKLLKNQYERANVLFRTIQTITKLNGEFKTFEFKVDKTRYNPSDNTITRRSLR